jgi:hypothetical protein
MITKINKLKLKIINKATSIQYLNMFLTIQTMLIQAIKKDKF